MISDSKRCEVSRKLRMLDVDGIEHGYELLEEVADCIGDEGVKYGAYERFAVLLADLIEPSGYECVPGECHDNDYIDRERLLAIATVMAADSVRSVKEGISVSPVYILHAARNIAEACGETFGSIRNRELAEWGTSIVPKETIVDRDTLLALADEMGRPIKQAVWNQTAGVRREHIMAEYARRIREACGEGAE